MPGLERLRLVGWRTANILWRELGLLAAIAVAAGSLWLFVEVADEVVEGETHAVDQHILLLLRNPEDRSDPIGPGWLEELGRDVTALGGMGILTFITLASALFLLLRGQRRGALFVLVAIASGIVASTLLKSGFDRPRPDLVAHHSLVYTASFPSGHSMMSAVVYLTLGALLARMQPDRRLKAYVLSLAVLVTFFVGISRIYLGVHWPTDVLAGWAAGAAWAMFCWVIVLWLQRHKQVEYSVEDEA
jgi:undecaprenyl-diphosphatase